MSARKRGFLKEKELSAYLTQEIFKENKVEYYRHEDVANSGIADISCTIDTPAFGKLHCWIELKVVPPGNHRDSTNLMKILKLRSEQRAFLVSKARCTHQFVGVLVYINKEFRLFTLGGIHDMPSLSYKDYTYYSYDLHNPLYFKLLQLAVNNGMDYQCKSALNRTNF